MIARTILGRFTTPDMTEVTAADTTTQKIYVTNGQLFHVDSPYVYMLYIHSVSAQRVLEPSSLRTSFECSLASWLVFGLDKFAL